MKIKFRDIKNLSKSNKVKLLKINEVIEKYAKMGYKLSLRQLYYRLVTENVIPNKANEYDKIMNLVTEGRLGGLIDWYAIEDRTRVPRKAYHVDGIQDALRDTENAYRLDRQLNQRNHIELWVEKDAISNILSPRVNYYGIILMVNRGYSSTSAMFESYKRMEAAIKEGKTPYILYLGDHDPSGLHMSYKDIPDRLNETFGTDVIVEHIGITMTQIQEFNPPPNPAKITDPRAGWYIDNYGESSWEVDALEPAELHNIVNSSIESLMDMDLFQEQVDQEVIDKREIVKLLPIKDSYERAKDLIDEKILDLKQQIRKIKDAEKTKEILIQIKELKWMKENL